MSSRYEYEKTLYNKFLGGTKAKIENLKLQAKHKDSRDLDAKSLINY